MQAISYRQSIFLLSMILPVTGHFLLLSPLFSISGRDSWISILFTLPIGLIFVFVLYRLHTLYPTKTVIEMLEEAFGRFIGKVMAFSILAYFLYMIIISLFALIDFIQVVFLPETPTWALAISFYLVILYGLSSGIESITRISELLFLIIIFSGLAIAITTLPDKDYSKLLPLFEKGISPVFNGILLTSALYGEFILLLMLKLKKDHNKSKSLLFTGIVSVFLITIMFLATTTSTLSIFGLEQVNNLQYPTQSIVRIVSFGFIERFDIYGIFTMVLGSVIRVSTFQFILNLGIRQWINIKKKWLIHFLITSGVILYSLFGIENHQYFDKVLLTKYYPLTAIISVCLPILCWLTLELKRRLSI